MTRTTPITCCLIQDQTELNPFTVQVRAYLQGKARANLISLFAQRVLDTSYFTGPNFVFAFIERPPDQYKNAYVETLLESNIFASNKAASPIHYLCLIAEIIHYRFKQDTPILIFPTNYYVLTADRDNFFQSTRAALNELSSEVGIVAVSTPMAQFRPNIPHLRIAQNDVTDTVVQSSDLVKVYYQEPATSSSFAMSSKTYHFTGVFALRSQWLLARLESHWPAWYRKLEKVEWGISAQMQQFLEEEPPVEDSVFFNSLSLYAAIGSYRWYSLKTLDDLSLVMSLS
jgi:hypothetical protein